MTKHIENREIVIKKLREEIIGPAPRGTELDWTKELVFQTHEEAFQPFKQFTSGEEILQRDAPLNRYGAGILFPLKKTEENLFEDETAEIQPDLFAEEDETKAEKGVFNEQAAKELAEMAEKTPIFDEEPELDLSSANRYLPSTIGISFLAEIPKNGKLVVEASGGRYRQLPVKIIDKDRKWWRRESVSIKAEFEASDLLSNGKISPVSVEKENTDNLNLEIEVFARPCKEENQRLLTVCFINRTETAMSQEHCFRASELALKAQAMAARLGHLQP